MALSDLLSRTRPSGRRASTAEAEPPGATAAAVALPSIDVDARVLYLANDPQEVKYVSGAFEAARPRLEFDFADSFEESRVRVRQASRFTAVVLGWSMPEALAITLLHKSQLEAPGIPVIVAGERLAQQFRDAGALACVGAGQEFLTELPHAIETAARHRRSAATVGPDAAATPQPHTASPTAPVLVPDAAHYPAPAPAPVRGPSTTASSVEPTIRVALVGNAAKLLPASVATAEDPEFRFVPAKDHEQAATCDVALIDHQDPALDVWQLVEHLRSRERPPVLVLLVNPNEPISTDLAARVDDFHVKSAGWMVQLSPRIQFAVSRTARLRDTAKTRKREERLRTLIDVLPACVLRLNRAGHIQALNPVAASLLGAPSPKVLLRKPFTALMSPASHEAWHEAFGRTGPGHPRSLELRVEGLSGEARIIETMIACLPPEPGQEASFVVVLRDVTSWRRLESSVEDAAVPSTLPVPPPVAHETEPVPVPVVPDLDELRRLERELLALSGRARQAFETLETELGRADAQHEAAQAARQATEARLNAVEGERWQSFDAFISAALSGIAYATTDGTLVSANASLAAMLGYATPNELTTDVPSLAALCGDETLQVAVARWTANESTAPVEVPCRRRDGTSALLRLRGARVAHGQDAQEHLQIVAEDLSERRVLESRLRRAHKWEHAFRTTAGLAADIKHALQHATDISTRLQGDGHAAPQSDHVAALHHATSKALALSQQLLAYGGREARASGPVDLNEVVGSTEDLIRRTLDDHVDVAFALAPEPQSVEADRGAVEELLVNVVHAAASALPVGGRLAIRTSSSVPASDGAGPVPADGYAVLTVSACGWGLDRTALSTRDDTDHRDRPADVLVPARRAAARLGGTLTVDTTEDAVSVHVQLVRAKDAEAVTGRTTS